MTQNPGTEQVQTGFFKKNRGLLLQALILMALWLILSGRFYFEPIFYGAVSVALVVWLNSKIRHIPLSNGEILIGQRIKIFRLIAYIPWLLWQIVMSAVFVAYLTLHPKLLINPMIVRFKSRLPNSLAKVILGNSISLTPGTLTLDIQDDFFTVHALVDKVEEDLVSGDMESRVGLLYLDACSPEEMCTDVSITKRGLEAKKALQMDKEKE